MGCRLSISVVHPESTRKFKSIIAKDESDETIVENDTDECPKVIDIYKPDS
jgi:hypothetical protein